MSKIIWVFGTSAAGKETFIKSLLRDHSLQKVLGIDCMKLAISEDSLNNLGKLDNSRDSIVEEVAQLLDSNEVVLIKWQYGDTLQSRLGSVYDKFPTVRHVAIKLNVGIDEQIRRLKTKPWWHDEGREATFIAKELSLVEKSIQQLGTEFIIIEHEW